MAFRTFLPLIAAIFLSSSLFAQDIQWQNALGGSGSDIPGSIRQTSDGGYIVGGHSKSNDGDVPSNQGEYDFWVLKLNNAGDTTWTRTLGGSDFDELRSIQQTDNGGYILTGESSSNDGDVSGNHGNDDYWVVKLNSSGDTTWTRSLGGSLGDAATSVQQTNDGGYIVAGHSSSIGGDVSGNHGDEDFWVVKLTSTGDTMWTRSLGGSGADKASSIQQTSDGGYVVVGFSDSNDGDVSGNHGQEDVWVVKLNSSGGITWSRFLGGSSSEYASSVDQTSDGGYIVAGHSNSSDGDLSGNHGDFDYWVLKLNSSGDTVWTHVLGGSGYEYSASIQQTNDGGYIGMGSTYSNDGDVWGKNGNYDCWVFKLNASGDTVWTRCLGGSGWDDGKSIRQTDDGGYIMSGKAASNDSDVSGNHGGDDFWVVKLDGQGSGGTALRDVAKTTSVQVHPNPTSGQICIDPGKGADLRRIAIRDLTGRTVKRQTVQDAQNFRTTIEGEPGLYFVELEMENGRREVWKVVKE